MQAWDEAFRAEQNVWLQIVSPNELNDVILHCKYISHHNHHSYSYTYHEVKDPFTSPAYACVGVAGLKRMSRHRYRQ